MMSSQQLCHVDSSSCCSMHGSSSSSVYKDLALPLAAMEIVEMETTSVQSYLERPTAQLMAEGTDSKRKGETKRARMQIVVEVSGEGSLTTR